MPSKPRRPSIAEDRTGPMVCVACGRRWTGTMPAGLTRLDRSHVGTNGYSCNGPFRLEVEGETP